MEYLPHENNDGDRFCDVCGYCMTHEYQWKDGSVTDDYAHEVYCDCGDTEYLPHENNDGDRVCDVCGYCMEHEYLWAEGGNANEYIHYLTCDCGEALLELHIDENEDEYCDLCSHSISCMHQDVNNDGFCDFCGICKEHSFEQQNWYIDEDAHYPKCDNCSYYVDIEREPHKDSNNDGICDICGNTDSTEPAICEHMITDNKCSVCGDELIVEIDESTGSRTYNGSEIIQAVLAIFGGTPLSEGTDYTVSYTNNIDVGTATVTVTGKEGTVYANINKTATFEIIPAEISIGSVAIQEKNYDGTTDAIVESMYCDGIVSGDEVVVSASAEFVDADAGKDKEVKVKDIELTGDDAKNYKIAAEFTSTGNIIPKDITVTPDAGQTKKCGEEDPVFTYEVEGIILDDTLEGILGREAGEDVGEYAYTIGTLSNSNYNIQLADDIKFVITKGEQSAPADKDTSQTENSQEDNSQANSPQTGDNSNLWLWFALLFTSSSALIVTVVYGSRKRYRTK